MKSISLVIINQDGNPMRLKIGYEENLLKYKDLQTICVERTVKDADRQMAVWTADRLDGHPCGKAVKHKEYGPIYNLLQLSISHDPTDGAITHSRVIKLVCGEDAAKYLSEPDTVWTGFVSSMSRAENLIEDFFARYTDA